MSWLTLKVPHTHFWERFREGAGWDVDAATRLLANRWQRVRALGADPEAISEPVETASALRERRERLDPLLAELSEVLLPASQTFAEQDYVLLLADAEGVVLEQAGGGGFEAEARRVRLIPGSHWSEATRGTNAIGTAIAEGCPVAVHGSAHWAQPNHGIVCYAAPVHDAAGEVVAVLDATSRLERAAPFAQLAVTCAARALEERLRALAWARARPDTALYRLLEQCSQPALVIERPGRVRRANAAAASWARRVRAWPWAPLEAAALQGEVVPILDAEGAELGRVRAEPVLDPEGRVLAVVLIQEAPRAAPAARDRQAAGDLAAFEALQGTDPRLEQTRALGSRLARTELPLLLLAETGTGKDLLARAIHKASPRAAGPFVALNCGALSEGLLDSELFGYGPGAFTGALKNGRDGYLAAAHRGTLFLDEVAEMPAALQARLLRFLECGTFHRVGESTERSADVRILCATCRDLPGLVQEGSFRADLYYRIRGAALTLPPLRERTDRAFLAEALLRTLAQESGLAATTLTLEAREAIAAWSWPGNIREMKNALRVALALSEDGQVGAEHLPAEVAACAPGFPAPLDAEEAPAEARVAALHDVEGGALRRALAAAAGNLTEAARRLGVARSTLYRMMDRHGLR